jgi:hypothetical protein
MICWLRHRGAIVISIVIVISAAPKVIVDNFNVVRGSQADATNPVVVVRPIHNSCTYVSVEV